MSGSPDTNQQGLRNTRLVPFCVCPVHHAPMDPPHHRCVSDSPNQCCHLCQRLSQAGCTPKPHLLLPKLACHITALEPFKVVEALGQPLCSLAVCPAAICQGVCASLVELLCAAHVGVRV